MQWLIDIVKEWVEEWFATYAGYHDRGHKITWDLVIANMTMDGTWQLWDLSGIIPEGVKAVNVFGTGTHADIHKHLKLSPITNASQRGETLLRTKVANVAEVGRTAYAVTTDRKIYYNAEAPNWSAIQMQIKGWWY